MKISSITSGEVLLAEPYMLDPNFKRAAILLCEHGKGGSIGFVMNRPLDTPIDALIDDFPEFSAEVMWGGPVQTDTLHYLHNVHDLLEDSVQVAAGVYWGGDFNKLKFLIASQLIQPEHIRFFLGYTGWGQGQLQEELKEGSWVQASMFPNYLFKTPAEDLWKQIMKHKGNAFEVIAHLPDTISWN